MAETFALVWQPLEGQSPLGHPLTSTVAFPYLLEGAEKHALEAGSVVELGERPLLLGILMGYHAEQRFVPRASCEDMRRDLASLAAIPGRPPLEIMLLNAAAYIRERFGNYAGRTALQTAMAVVPTSAMIRSDFLAVTWVLIHERDPMNLPQLLEEFARTFPRLDLSLIDPAAAEELVSAELHILTWLGRLEERDGVVRSNAASYVVSTETAKKIAALLAGS